MTGDSAAAMRSGLELAQWTALDLWRAELGVGGGFKPTDIEALVAGERTASEADHDILATVLNDHFIDQGANHPVPYWRDLHAQDAQD
jgi:hypothetical protein